MKDKQREVRGKRDFPSREQEARDLTEEGDEDEEGEKFVPLPEEEQAVVNAKMYMQQHSTDSGTNLYDHLSHLLGDILMDKPTNAFRNMENLSLQRKRERLEFKPSTIQDRRTPSQTTVLATAQSDMLKKAGKERELYAKADTDEIMEKDQFHILPDLVRQAYYFEQVGFGLPREEFVRISVAMRHIVSNWPVTNIRFWGKILGTQKNYYVAETEFEEGEYESDTSDVENDEEEESRMTATTDSIFDDVSIVTDEIKPTYRQPPRIPCESLGTGLNRKIYFVCSEPGLPWHRLPHITPAQVVGARQIRRFMTGDLDAQIVSYPPFPGTERNFLRAQIGRISAATSVSPIGYFRFDDQEEEEEAGEEESAQGRSLCMLDSEFNGISMYELLDPTFQAWCHHTQAILPQGRNTWFNPVRAREDEDNEESLEEERDEPDEPEPEVGPPLLSPLSEDQNVGDNPAWVVKSSSKLVPEFSIVVLQSNTWPGAVTFGAERGKFFENIYVGWGVKNLASEFNPELPPTAMDEFPSGPEITETDDPTPEEEAAVSAAKREREEEMEGDDDAGGDDDDDD